MLRRLLSRLGLTITPTALKPSFFTTHSDDREEAPRPVREEFFREYRALLAEDEPWKEEVFMLEVMPKIAANYFAHGPPRPHASKKSYASRTRWLRAAERPVPGMIVLIILLCFPRFFDALLRR